VADVFHIPAQPASKEFQRLVEKAVASLVSGAVIVMPSDTLYGLFSLYGDAQIERLHSIKKRPVDKPFLLVFPESYPLDDFVNMLAIDSVLEDKIVELWPGKNTLVLPKNQQRKYPPGETIAIRKPLKNDNVFFYETLNVYGKPLLAPSLNLHGDQPLSSLDDIKSIFDNKIDFIFFDSAFVPGQASRIWNLAKKPFTRLR
jgi:L-threonylcarbamoyladenylate synthase